MIKSIPILAPVVGRRVIKPSHSPHNKKDWGRASTFSDMDFDYGLSEDYYWQFGDNRKHMPEDQPNARGWEVCQEGARREQVRLEGEDLKTKDMVEEEEHNKGWGSLPMRWAEFLHDWWLFKGKYDAQKDRVDYFLQSFKHANDKYGA